MGEGEKKREYVVKAGDRMSKIAHQHGYKDYQLLYLAQPDEFRKKRPNPEILMEGDVVILPDKIEEKHSAKDKKAHTYEEDTRLPEVRVALRLAGKPLANKSFGVVVDPPAASSGKPPVTGMVKSDGDGKVAFHVEPAARKVLLICTQPIFSVELRLGELRPVAEAGGVEQRLDNLNYRVPLAPPPAPAGSEAEKKAHEAQERRVKKAVQRFQEDRKQAVDGRPSAALQKLLVKEHEPT